MRQGCAVNSAVLACFYALGAGTRLYRRGVIMKKKNKDMYYQSKRDRIASGGFLILIGILFIVMGIAADAPVGSAAAIIGISATVIIIGVCQICSAMKIKEEYMRDAAANSVLSDGNGAMTKHKRNEFEKSLRRCALKMFRHGGIREVMVNRMIYISGAILAVCTVFDIIMLCMGYISFVFIIMNIGVLVFFIVSLFPKQYKRTLEAYKNPVCGGEGLDKEEAEKEFSEGALFILANNIICMGNRYVFGSCGQCYALEINRIVWVFPRRQLQNNYVNGIYSGTTEIYSMIFCMDDGSVWKFDCEIGACNLITQRIDAYNRHIAMGWSETLNEIYLKNPADFRFECAKVPHPDMFTVQM